VNDVCVRRCRWRRVLEVIYIAYVLTVITSNVLSVLVERKAKCFRWHLKVGKERVVQLIMFSRAFQLVDGQKKHVQKSSSYTHLMLNQASLEWLCERKVPLTGLSEKVQNRHR